MVAAATPALLEQQIISSDARFLKQLYLQLAIGKAAAEAIKQVHGVRYKVGSIADLIGATNIVQTRNTAHTQVHVNLYSK